MFEYMVYASARKVNTCQDPYIMQNIYPGNQFNQYFSILLQNICSLIITCCRQMCYIFTLDRPWGYITYIFT